MGAQVSTINKDFCDQHGYDVYPVKEMLYLEGMGGFSIPYLGNIEAISRIPLIEDYEECVPMLVLKSFSPFGLRVPVQLDTTVLDWEMAKIMEEELTHASSMWLHTYMSTVVTAGVASTNEQECHNTSITNTPLFTTKSIVIPPLVV